MFEKVIVATDLSRNSDVLVNCLGELKAYGTQRCLLLLCLNMQETASIALSYSSHQLEKSLQNQKESLEEQGLIVEARILSGDLKNEINKIAVDEDYSAIIVGAKINSMISELFFSGIADDVIHHSQKPVFVIRLEDNPKAECSCVEAIGCNIGNHILFPTDFSQNADFAFKYLTEITIMGAKKITLLHVQDKSRISPYLENRLEEFNEIDNQRLQKMKKILQEKGNIEVETVLKYGSPSVEIIKLVNELNIKLVVIGNQGRGFFKELFLGSVSNNIARLSPSSVLLISMDKNDLNKKRGE